MKHDLQIAIDFLAVAVLLLFASIWAYTTFISTPPYVDENRYPIKGIDISSHNGMMNLQAAADDGISFAFIKATEGKNFRDENFRLNYQKAKEAGLMVGAYHFFRFDRGGVEQAINLLDAVGDRKLDLGIVIDVENEGNATNIDRQTIIDRLGRMIEYLNLKGHRVMIYTNRNGYYDYVAEDFRGMPLWICSFQEVPINAEWAFWQYNHRGKVKGIKGNVDLNVFAGNKTEWDIFLTTGNLPS